MNRTAEYQEAVKRHAIASGCTEEQLQQLQKAQILRSLAASGDFTRAATDVLRNLNTLLDFVKSNRHNYVQPGRLTDAERDQIEQEVALSVRTCSANIERLERNVQLSQNIQPPNGPNQSTIAFRLGVALSLSERLKHATTLFDGCRAVRSKQIAQQRQLKRALDKPPGRRGMGVNGVHSRGAVEGQQTQAQQMMQRDAWDQDLLDTHEQVSRVERSMLEVSALHQMFATQVLHQSQQIEEIYMQAVRATNNLQSGNTNLKKAIRLNTSARLYVLFLMLLASAGLLFLDWYSS